jgi:hypothetical protein
MNALDAWPGSQETDQSLDASVRPSVDGRQKDRKIKLQLVGHGILEW